MGQLNNSCTYYSLLDDALGAAKEALALFQSGEEEQLSLVYVDAEPPDDSPINLIYAPFGQLTELFLQTTLPLPERFIPGKRSLPEAVIEYEKQRFSSTINQIRKTREQHLQNEHGSLLALDTLFLNRKFAYATALQGNHVYLGHPNILGQQVCHYEGEVVENSPENLIQITSEDLITYFTESRRRIPAHLVIPPGVPEQDKRELLEAFKQLHQAVVDNREALDREAIANCQKQAPPPLITGNPLRIYLPASRLTEVMQYASKGLAEAFKTLGHEVWLSIEQNAMEQLDYQHPQEQYLFNPHLVVNINHMNNQWMHPDLFNVIWWQDPMPELLKNESASYRKNDIVYTIDPNWIERLPAPKRQEAEVQNFCIDQEIYNQDYDEPREDKVIFIGSSYRHWYDGSSHETKQAMNKLIEDFELGLQLTDERINFYALKYSVPPEELKLHRLNYIVRDTSVRWLCEQRIKEVEVYGRGWDYCPVVKEKFKGELAHGHAVAEAYNRSEYTLACHPAFVFSQRLAEAAACGATPLVYDSRYAAFPPFFDDQCLYYSTKEEMIEQLTKKAKTPPDTIADDYTYLAFAQRIVAAISEKLESH